MKSSILLASLVLASVPRLALAQAATATPTMSASEQLAVLNQESPRRDLLLSNAQNEVRQLILETPNFSRMTDWMTFAVPTFEPLAGIAGQSENWYLGSFVVPGEGDSLILKTVNGSQRRLLFSLKSLNQGDHLHIQQAVVSKDQRYAAVLISKDGQNTEFHLLVYSLATSQIVVPFSSYLVSDFGIKWDDQSQNLSFL